MQYEIQSLRETTAVDDYMKSHGLDNNAISEKNRRRGSITTIDVSPSTVSEPGFHGCTSSEYSLKLASKKLMGRLQDPVPGPRSDVVEDVEAYYGHEDGEDQNPRHADKAMRPDTIELYDTVSVRVFTELPLSRARELIEIYADAAGTVHPIVDLALISRLMEQLYSSMGDRGLQPAKDIRYHDVTVIRLVLAIALVADQEKSTELIHSCYEGVDTELHRLICSETVGLRGIILIVLGVIVQPFTLLVC